MTTKTSEQKKVAKKPVTKVKKPTFADALDVILIKGGTWEEMIEKASKEAEHFKLKSKVTKGLLRSHAAYRIKRNKEYLRGKILGDTGVILPHKVDKKK